MECNVAGAGWVIGRRATPGNVRQATVSSGATLTRVIAPGQPVTMEFNPDRLTITVSARNRIVDIRCG